MRDAPSVIVATYGTSSDQWNLLVHNTSLNYMKAQAALDFVSQKAAGDKRKAALDILHSDKLEQLPADL